jgi:hypothetical protein
LGNTKSGKFLFLVAKIILLNEPYTFIEIIGLSMWWIILIDSFDVESSFYSWGKSYLVINFLENQVGFDYPKLYIIFLNACSQKAP